LREKSDSAEREKLESWSRIKRKIKEKKKREKRNESIEEETKKQMSFYAKKNEINNVFLY